MISQPQTNNWFEKKSYKTVLLGDVTKNIQFYLKMDSIEDVTQNYEIGI